MSSTLFGLLQLLPTVLLQFIGILVFQMKFQRLPQVRILGTIGFSLMLGSSASQLFSSAIFESQWRDLVFFVLRLLSWTGMALVLFAIGSLPVPPALQAGERD